MDRLVDRPNIFVSYSLRGGYVTRQELEAVEKVAESFGSVFIDLIHNNHPRPQRRVLRAIHEADAVWIVESPALLTSEWVRLELGIAQARDVPTFRIARVLSGGVLQRQRSIAVRGALVMVDARRAG